MENGTTQADTPVGLHLIESRSGKNESTARHRLPIELAQFSLRIHSIKPYQGWLVSVVTQKKEKFPRGHSLISCGIGWFSPPFFSREIS